MGEERQTTEHVVDRIPPCILYVDHPVGERINFAMAVDRTAVNCYCCYSIGGKR